VPLVEQELLTLPEHLSSPPIFSEIHVTRSLIVCVYFVDCCLSFCTFFFLPLCCLFFFDMRILITPLFLQTLLRGSPAIVNTCIFIEFLISCCFILSTKPKSGTQITDRVRHLFIVFFYMI
jgi:hypothetical protein